MTDRSFDYDVIVAGGGSAGVAAAAASARMGARTLLVERYNCLGGASTMRNVATYCGLYTLGESPRRVVGGIGEEVMQGLRKQGAVSGPRRYRGVSVAFDPEAVKFVLDELAAAAGVTVMFSSFVAAAERRDGRMRTATVAGHSGLKTFSARAFVDCTGEGDLAAFADASTRYGNGADVNLGTLATRFGGIAPSAPLTPRRIAEAVAGLGAKANSVTKDRAAAVRLPISGDVVLHLASEDYDPRDSLSMSAAEVRGRRQAWAYLEALRTIEGCEDAYLVSTGPEFGTRESRHLNCLRQLTWDDIENRAGFEDCIALGGWGAEWHDRATYLSSLDFPPDRGAYEIPLGCLRSVDTANLFCAGRLADGDRKAGAAIRVMGTAFATGQAAGIAATLEADGRFAVSAVQAALRKQDAILDPADIPA